MRKRNVFIFAGIAILAVAAVAQESRSSIALAGTGLFTSQSSGHDPFGSNVTRQADNAGGFLVSYRYRLSRWLAAEGDYGLARNSMQFSTTSGPFRGDAYMHQATAGFIVNLPTRARFRFTPYLLAEGGALIFSPTSGGFTTTGGFSSNPAASGQTKGAFIYGGGGDFAIAKHWSLRAEYRGLVYHTPDFGVSTLATGTVSHTAQPSLGIAYRF